MRAFEAQPGVARVLIFARIRFVLIVGEGAVWDRLETGVCSLEKTSACAKPLANHWALCMSLLFGASGRRLSPHAGIQAGMQGWSGTPIHERGRRPYRESVGSYSASAQRAHPSTIFEAIDIGDRWS